MWYRGKWARWQSKKTLSSPPLTSTPKSQLSAEQPLKKTHTHTKHWNPPEKISYTKRHKEGTATKPVVGGDSQYNQIP